MYFIQILLFNIIISVKKCSLYAKITCTFLHLSPAVEFLERPWQVPLTLYLSRTFELTAILSTDWKKYLFQSEPASLAAQQPVFGSLIIALQNSINHAVAWNNKHKYLSNNKTTIGSIYMKDVTLRTFKSPLDFMKKFLGIFKGPTFISTFYKTDRKFAEQVFLIVAMKNNCHAWASFHSALGKRHGLTDNDLTNLTTISKEDFDHKVWVALKYAHEWTVLYGREPDGDFMEEFKSLYTKKEQGRINKLMRIMLFSNYLMNFIYDRPWKRDTDQKESTTQ